MSVFIVLISLYCVISLLFFVFFRKYPIKKALYYSFGVCLSALIVFILAWYNPTAFGTKLGQLLVAIPLGLLLWYIGERLFSDTKETASESRKHKKTLPITSTTEIQVKTTGVNGTDIKNTDSNQCNFKVVQQATIEQTSDIENEFQFSDNQVEKYEFEWVLADKIQILTISEYIRNNTKISLDNLDRQSVNLAYGVTDKDRKIYLTLIYYLSDLVMRTDTFIDVYKFAFIAGSEVLLTSCGIRREEILDLKVEHHSEYFNMISQAIAFYNNRSTSALEEAFKKEHPNTYLYQYNELLLKEHLYIFKEETLGFIGETDTLSQSTLLEFCDILNQNSISSIYTVEHFRSMSKYDLMNRRLINYERDVWLYFMGCTDGTHAPMDFLESEWLIFYYKGFVIRLDFEEHRATRCTFKLKLITTNKQVINSKNELNHKLEEQGIAPNQYHMMLQIALNTRRPNYYDLRI